MNCIRCGAEGHTEYAPDGQSYCSACLFYGLNKPCWKCRMYLPSTELQQYNGQWTCPYCIMDLKDSEKKSEEGRGTHAPGKSGEKDILSGVPEDEYCDRCKRKLVIVYIFNNRKLCEVCIEREKKDFEEAGSGATPMVLRFKLGGKEGMLSSLFRTLEIAVSRIMEKRKKSSIELAKQEKNKKDKNAKEKSDEDKRTKGSTDNANDTKDDEEGNQAKFSKYFKD